MAAPLDMRFVFSTEDASAAAQSLILYSQFGELLILGANDVLELHSMTLVADQDAGEVVLFSDSGNGLPALNEILFATIPADVNGRRHDVVFPIGLRCGLGRVPKVRADNPGSIRITGTARIHPTGQEA